MFPKKEVVAMLLAGGQGSRLGVLTRKIAKPAVPFGGKYRIIDFPLSNCVNSGIEAVGILTQYQPLVLNEYIGNGQPWDLDGMHSGVNCLSPYQAVDGADWYSGTANAIFQNINYIDRYDPEYVVVLSGDHIYKMDYNKMLEYHKEKNAACTIAVIDVPLEEASRFGILNTHEDGEIYEFDEKPEKPKSTHASMGIYIFSYIIRINTHNISGIKIHSTYIVKNTKLSNMYENGEYTPITYDEYLENLVYIITHINPKVIVHRISADPPKDLLVAPEWCLHKKWVTNNIDKLLEEQNLVQGMFY